MFQSVKDEYLENNIKNPETEQVLTSWRFFQNDFHWDQNYPYGRFFLVN